MQNLGLIFQTLANFSFSFQVFGYTPQYTHTYTHTYTHAYRDFYSLGLTEGDGELAYFFTAVHVYILLQPEEIQAFSITLSNAQWAAHVSFPKSSGDTCGCAKMVPWSPFK